MVPPVPGLKESPRTVTLRSAQCARRLEQAASNARRAVVLGASLVGVKVAEILQKRGIQVTLIDLAARMLPNSAHPIAAEMLKSYFEKKGVDVRLGLALQRVGEEMDGVELHFPDGYSVKADFCAVCTGIRPNLGFLDRSQVEIDKAILVDETMETTAPDLFAAGDVCQGLNIQSGQREWLGLWGNACYQGRTAGTNMAGGRVTYAGTVPQHVSPFFDITFAEVGDIHRTGEGIRLMTGGDPAVGMFHLLVFDGACLIGVNLVNGFRDIGAFKTAILRRLDWSDFLAAHEQPPFEEIERYLNLRLNA